METKRNSLRNKVLSVILAGASLLTSTKAKAGSVNPKDYESQKRVLEMDFAHPLATPESRANTTYSANQIADYILNETNEDSFLMRLGKTATNVWVKNFTAYVSHEAGHEDENLRFRSGIRWRSLTPQIAPSEKVLDTIDERLRYSSAGLNQNTLNADKIWENGQRFGNFDNTGFLFNSLYGAFYSPDSSTRGSANCANDLESYCNVLAKKGINETTKDLKRKSLIVSALTLQNWASIWNAVNYTITGRTNNDPLTFKIGNMEITSPIFSHYLTGEGSYFQGDIFLNPQGQIPVKLSTGFSDNKIRAGAKAYDLNLVDNFSVSPFAYVDSHGGNSLGTDLTYALTKNIGLTAKIEQNNKDILENDVKDKENRVNIKFGIVGRF